MNRYHAQKTNMGTLIIFLAVAIWIQLGVWGPFSGPVEAAEGVTLSCSAQVFEVLKGETLSAFTQKTGIPVDPYIFTSDDAVSRLTLGLREVAAVAGPLSLSHKSRGYLEHPFCKDALVVIGNAQVGIKDLTKAQLRAVFSGVITNWSQLGGPDRPIRVIIPNRESAAYRNFTRMVMGGLDIAYYALAYRSTAAGDLTRCVPWGVSFVNLAATHGRPKGIRIININGFSPQDRNYPFIQTFSIVTKGQPGKEVRKLLEFLASEEAGRILLKRGVTPCSVCEEGVMLRHGKAGPVRTRSSTN